MSPLILRACQPAKPFSRTHFFCCILKADHPPLFSHPSVPVHYVMESAKFSLWGSLFRGFRSPCLGLWAHWKERSLWFLGD